VKAEAISMPSSKVVLLSEGLMERLGLLIFGRRWLVLGETEPREEADPQFWVE